MESPSASEPRYFCPVCGAGFGEKQSRYGVSIVRGGDVYCHACFKKAFPDECENHPGVKATRSCAVCEKRFCVNCVTEIQGREVCNRCKGRVLTGLLAQQDRPVGKLSAVAYRISTVWRHSPVAIFLAGILGFFFCGIPGIVAITGYVGYRERVFRGRAPRSVLAIIGFILGVLSLVFYAVILLVMVFIGNSLEVRV